MWFSGKVTLNTEEGRRTISVVDVVSRNTNGLPKGTEVNADLADPHSALRREVEAVWHGSGQITIGTMRVLNGGGAYSLPANLLDLSCEDGPHEAMWEKLTRKMGGEPETATPVVFRGWGAPGTFAVFDGGGVGRGESRPDNIDQFLCKHCLGENFGEIGMLAHLPDGSEGRIGYYCGHTFGLGEQWLNTHIQGEWCKAHRVVPLTLTRAKIDLLELPDTLILQRIGMARRNVKLAIEWHSASVECLTLSHLTFEEALPGMRLRFIDLESRVGKGALNRRIGIVLKRGDDLALISYKGGVFDHDFPSFPINPHTIRMFGNEKFESVIEMIMAK